MKKYLGMIALSMSLLVVPLNARREDEARQTKKTTVTEKRTERRKAGERKRVEKDTKKEEKKVNKSHHKKEVKKKTSHTHTTTGNEKVVGHTADGKPIYEGPRGGHYYTTASGNKEYVQQ